MTLMQPAVDRIVELLARTKVQPHQVVLAHTVIGLGAAWLLAGVLLWALLSTVVLRAVHHWSGVEWSAALWHDGTAQAGLTLLWSVLGMAAWIAGSRRGERGTWLAGAALMGLVLAKLVLVDWQDLGNLPGILSFIAYGLLCLAVGYFAPAPPRRDAPAAG